MSTVRTQHTSFSLIPQETLLDGLERTGHEVEYQCRGGYCGMCRVRLLDGEVQYLEQPLAFVAADEILPCCCVPRSDVRVDCELRPELRGWQGQEDMFPVQQPLFADALPLPEQPPAKKTRRKRTTKSAASASNLSLF
ncbi:class I ribonucleotide reductase maintenance protein YfaE [Methylobacillus sp. Pita2]|uniref:class I ribonucleotide reductase maintenance protein YfaE n=1 Tax=Methylobacillus TaxID=404 RepID=UPI002853BCA4|nr:class I ribonucleotide reductase maintenance protein YfaE [Methylobacillus flagellatus]MDR5171163.1 2Fe-2S ferredoxin-like protein [Methylobacillus flagellatus]